MSDHKDSKDQSRESEELPEYLLDDEELAAAISEEFEAAQKSGDLPDDNLRLQRNWRELKSKLPETSSKPRRSFASRWTPILGAVAAAVLIMLVWPVGPDSGSDLGSPAIFKGGENVEAPVSQPRLKLEKLEEGVWKVDIEMVSDPKPGSTERSLFISILAGNTTSDGTEEDVAKLFWQGDSRDWSGSKQINSKSLGLSVNAIKVCLLTADSKENLDQKVAITLENFGILQLAQCVNAP